MKLKCILVFMVILTFGTTACSSNSREDAVHVETESASDGENTVSDPISGIVEKYEDDIIVIKDPADGILYYFSTKNALITEETDSPIAVGDKVEITYQGLLGDEKNPCEAVKITAGTAK